MRRIRIVLATCVVVAALALAAAGCSKPPESVTDSREALGTVVSVTAYPSASWDASKSAEAIERAYSVISDNEETLDAYAFPTWLESRFEIGYDPDPERYPDNIVLFNTMPFYWRVLPEPAERIIERIDALGVSDYFSPALFEVTALYNFDTSGTVPPEDKLAYALEIAHTFKTRLAVGTREARFDVTGTVVPPSLVDDPVWYTPRAGLDLGGAAKGYALEQAITALKTSQAFDGALITAGSTTATFGDKPDGALWRVGVEDPRDPEAVIATVEGTGAFTVSTSGDYQRYFEADGVRYHHILDPATGKPARGLESLTVVGDIAAMDSDILSTALFVMGPDKATAYAEEHDLGLVMVDEEGQVHVVPGPEGRTWEITTE